MLAVYHADMASSDKAVRTAVARAGGLARMAKGDPAELLATRRAAAAAINNPAALARRIVKAWPGLSRTERAEVRAILAVIKPR